MKKKEGNETRWPKRADFLDLLQAAFLSGVGYRRYFCTWCENISHAVLFMFGPLCLCVIEWSSRVGSSVKVLYHELDREKCPLFRALHDADDAVRSMETVREMACFHRSLFFTLEELGYEEPATEAGRACAWHVFWGVRPIFFTQSDR